MVWAVWVARPYLNLDPKVVPIGREYGQDIMPHDFWRLLLECGPCALWFGGARGGSPALIEPFNSSMLHPLVVVSSVILGVENGAKIALAGALLMAGVAQWWLGRVLLLSWPARLWTAAMVVVGGHLAGKMELGAYATLFALAGCALVLPALVALKRTPTNRAAVIFGVILALAALSGRWYMQIGLVLASPAALLLLLSTPESTAPFLRRLALAVALAGLLSAPFIVPFLHFLPELAKDADASFKGAQPFGYVPLNLVIADRWYYLTTTLDKFPFPAHYVTFVGWIPILLAIWGLGGARRGIDAWLIAFLSVSVVLVLWVASATPLEWLVSAVPVASIGELVAGVRYPAFIAGLAVPPCLHSRESD
jgi:hypothetical protein